MDNRLFWQCNISGGQCARLAQVMHRIKVLPDAAKTQAKSLVWRRKAIVAMAFANDFFPGGHVELFRLALLYHYYLIGYVWNLLAIAFFIIAIYYLIKILYLIICFYYFFSKTPVRLIACQLALSSRVIVFEAHEQLWPDALPVVTNDFYEIRTQDPLVTSPVF